MHRFKRVILSGMGCLFAANCLAEKVNIGLNYPQTGPYAAMGLDQRRAADLAKEEINAAGGILGQQVEMIYADSEAKAATAVKNARKMIQEDKVKMLFGGSASSEAIAVGKEASEAKIPFFATLSYSTDTTGIEGKEYVFRECYDSGAAARVLSEYLNKNYKGKKYYYITARYNWGYTTEQSFRDITGSTDMKEHGRTYTPFPDATKKDFDEAIQKAVEAKPDVLVVVLFGEDMGTALKLLHEKGLNKKFAVIVPNLTLGMAEAAGPEAMEGVVGALPWSWKVPFEFGFKRGQDYVNSFVGKYNSYPTTSGASAYTIMYEYKAAVERAGSFESDKVVKALKNHRYTLLKDEQHWAPFNNQSIQTVYAVKCRPAEEVKKSKFQQDYFEIIQQMEGPKAFLSEAEWKDLRKKNNKTEFLEPVLK